MVIIASNVIHTDLYELSKASYNDFPVEKRIISGEGGLYGLSFFEKAVKEFTDADWMIYIDEDCFISDLSAMSELLTYQITNNIHFSGMPDGGVISHRFHNPVSINPFFTIINLKWVREQYHTYNRENRYSDDLVTHTPKHLLKKNFFNKDCYKDIVDSGYTPFGVSYDNFEPYYNFFFWMLRQGANCLYLDADDTDIDCLTTVLYNHKCVPFAYHTWFARLWDNPKNKERIINVSNVVKKNRL